MNQTATTKITLESPVQRTNSNVTEVLVRKPKAGELRGASLVNLINMDVASLEVVLPRITQPVLSRQEVGALDPADLTAIGMAVTSFLLPKAASEDFPTE